MRGSQALSRQGRIALILLLSGVIVWLLAFIIAHSAKGPIHLWDEALYANNALDMARYKHWGVYTVADTIDHQNTKPPLALWMEAASGAAFGFNEFSVRLPTYCALAGILVLLVIYLQRWTRSAIPGLLAAILALTNTGLIRHHVFLTADLDGVLTFWTTWIVLHWLSCLRTGYANIGDYVLLTSLFCAGFLTKSTAILLIVPSLAFIGLLYWRQCLRIIASRHFLLSAVAFLLFVPAYYLIREHYDRGYWSVVWMSEFTRLTENVQPWLESTFSSYFRQFYDPQFQEYLLLTAALSLPYFIIRPPAQKKTVAALIAATGAFLLMISFPPVRLAWYDAPAYPLACCALALMIWELIKAAYDSRKRWAIAAGIVLALVTAISIKNSFIHVADEAGEEPHNGYAHQAVPDALKIMHDRHRATRRFSVLIPPTAQRFAHQLDELTFYKGVYDRYEHKEVNVSDRPKDFIAGDTIICSRAMLEQLQPIYFTTRLDSTEAGVIWVKLDAKPAGQQ